MKDISDVLFYKLWWNFRTNEAMWSKFIKNKYYKREDANEVMWKLGESQVWKKMLRARDLIEHQIL